MGAAGTRFSGAATGVPHCGDAQCRAGRTPNRGRVGVLAPPEIRFAERDGVHLAYQCLGAGPPDLVFVAGALAMSLQWEDPASSRVLRRLASFSRLVVFDQRGMGYSDRIDTSATLTVDDLVADLETVIEAAGVTDPVLFGLHNGGAVAAAYAARHPVRQLVVCNTWARLERAPDFPIGLSDETLDHMEERYRTKWGGGYISNQYAARRRGEPLGRYEMASTNLNQVLALYRLNRTYDVRHLLPRVTAPTLVLHTEDNVNVPADHGRYIAEQIPGARLVLLSGADQIPLRNAGNEMVDEVQQFVAGTRTAFVDRMRTAMLFTDIVDSTPLAARLGDEAWSALVDEHNVRMLRHVTAHGGQEVKSTGDGFLVAFDAPDAAARCALAAVGDVAELGLAIRAGVHVGEVTPMGLGDFAGLAVHFAQRLCARAEGGQVLTSAAVREACEGSGLAFEEGGTAMFKGIPGTWEVFEVRA